MELNYGAGIWSTSVSCALASNQISKQLQCPNWQMTLYRHYMIMDELRKTATENMWPQNIDRMLAVVVPTWCAAVKLFQTHGSDWESSVTNAGQLVCSCHITFVYSQLLRPTQPGWPPWEGRCVPVKVGPTCSKILRKILGRFLILGQYLTISAKTLTRHNVTPITNSRFKNIT